MWLLLIVFAGAINNQELHRYASFDECQTERDRIGYLMAESYPEEHSFDIVCQFRKVKETA